MAEHPHPVRLGNPEEPRQKHALAKNAPASAKPPADAARPGGIRNPNGKESPTVQPSNSLVPLESVLCTEDLNRRPMRRPDFETENRALLSLVRALAESPGSILQTLADMILEVLQAGSAGISLLTKHDGGKRFYWPAIAGVWKPHIGGGTPREFGPCGDVLDRNAPLLFRQLERRYTYFQAVTPAVEEALLAPFYVDGKAVGTVWAVTHDERRIFDAEDLRRLTSLGTFASSAYQVMEFSEAMEQKSEALRQNHTELAQSVTELRKANAEAQNSRRAALNLMEDAVQAHGAMEGLNTELRESEERYRTLFDLGPVAVYSCDVSGVIQKFNHRAAELWGHAPATGDTDERFCGASKLIRPDGSPMPHEECPMAEVLSGKIPAARDAEVLIERPDGSLSTVVVNIRALRDAEGRITGAINCFYDITERKRVEEALRRAQTQLADHAGQLEKAVAERTAELTNMNKQLEAFIYSIAHDLRAPLRAMQGFSSLLVEETGATLGETNRDYAQRINKSAQFMDALLGDLLNFSRISQQRLELTSVNLEDVVGAVLFRLQKDIVEKKAQVKSSGPWGVVLAHEPTLSQVLFNLVSNALKFIGPDTSLLVRLRAEEPGEFIRVWVEDNGIGIATEHQDQIFRLFNRLHGEKYPGTGIGLAIVQRGVERMGGRVGLESVPGQGSRFWFELKKA